MKSAWSFMHKEAQEHDVDAVEMLQWLLACLRAQYWAYQQAHWQVRGGSFYGNHLLFQRLYESVVDQTDTLAEKMVGVYGGDAVDGMDLGAKFEAWLRRWDQVDCLHQRGILSEQDFQSACRSVYERLGQLGELTLGMDDFLMATANEHETNEYLLRQVLRQKQASTEWDGLRKANEE